MGGCHVSETKGVKGGEGGRGGWKGGRGDLPSYHGFFQVDGRRRVRGRCLSHAGWHEMLMVFIHGFFCTFCDEKFKEANHGT